MTDPTQPTEPTAQQQQQQQQQARAAEQARLDPQPPPPPPPPLDWPAQTYQPQAGDWPHGWPPPQPPTYPPPATQPAAVAPPAAAAGGSPRILSAVENALKLIAGGLGLVAAMGFPAVYFHFSRFGVPAHFASYDLILRAGVLPAVLLVFVGAYIYWGVKVYRARGSGSNFFVGLLTIFAPFTLLIGAINVVGLLAVLSLLHWGAVWLAARALGPLIGIDVTRRHLLYATAASAVLSALVSRLKVFRGSLLGFWAWLGKRTAPRRAAGGGPGGWLSKTVLWFVVGIPLVVVAMLYSIKAATHVLELHPPAYLNRRFIFTFGLAAFLIYAASVMVVFSSEWIKSVNESERWRGFAAAVGILAAIYLTSMAVYSSALYGRIPRGLGGGRPDRIVFWIARDDLPPDVPGRLARSACAGDEKTIRCENIYLLYEDSDVVIVTDAAAPPVQGVLIPRDKIKALSW